MGRMNRTGTGNRRIVAAQWGHGRDCSLLLAVGSGDGVDEFCQLRSEEVGVLVGKMMRVDDESTTTTVLSSIPTPG